MPMLKMSIREKLIMEEQQKLRPCPRCQKQILSTKANRYCKTCRNWVDRNELSGVESKVKRVHPYLLFLVSE